jgi:hypothetical protein
MVEKFRITLSKTGPNEGRIELAWEDTVASVRFLVKDQNDPRGIF